MMLVNYRGFIGPKEANDIFLFSNWFQVFNSIKMVKLGYIYAILSVLMSNFDPEVNLLCSKCIDFWWKINLPIPVFGKQAFAFFWSNLETNHSKCVQNFFQHLIVSKMHGFIALVWKKQLVSWPDEQKKMQKMIFLYYRMSQYRQI